MSDTNNNETALGPAEEPKRLGLLAQFASPDDMVAAAQQITDSGYTKVEAFTPFPVLGIDHALKAKGTILPWIVFAMGCTGGTIAILMQWYTNATEWGNWLSGYQYTISAKPFFSLPADIPVTFELIILLSAFGAFFGMLMLNGLPKLSNPLFRSDRFLSATTDGFFLFVESDDPKYAEAETEAYLTSVGAEAVEAIDDEVEGKAVPGFIFAIGLVAASVALLPPLWIWSGTNAPTKLPRISFFKDMESQAKFKPQQTSDIFRDGRAMRVAVDGTIARGGLKDNIQYEYGVESLESLTEAGIPLGSTKGKSPFQFVQNTDDAANADAASTEEPPEPDWVKDFPVTVTTELMERGRQRFDIYCATCHGLGGDGDGLITQRALALEQGTWIQPTSLHVEAVTSQPAGKIYNTITNGVRKMPGYHSQIATEDRWAIVLYVQALQRSRAATAEDVPKDKLQELSNRK